MKVLIIGTADSIYIKSLIEWTFIPFEDKVSVLSSKNTLYSDYYSKNGVEVLELGQMNKLSKIKALAKRYDLVNVHYINRGSANKGRINGMFSKRFILSFWGSDILRVEKADPKISRAIKAASVITMSTSAMEEKFHEVYGYSYDSKIRNPGFGCNGLEVLRTNKSERSALMKKFSVSEDKVVVSIGYNKAEAQQHIKVLQVIRSLPEDIQSKMHIILRLTYGNCGPDYVERIKEALLDLNCTYTIFESFLSDEEFAELTQLTDVFIHAQKTDAMSAAVCEHLYAGCVLLNPSWIRYSKLKDKAFYLEYNDFDELGVLLSDNIIAKTESRYRSKLEQNADVIYDICSWESLVPAWRNVYSGE